MMNLSWQQVTLTLGLAGIVVGASLLGGPQLATAVVSVIVAGVASLGKKDGSQQ